jgi:hypothetical protein
MNEEVRIDERTAHALGLTTRNRKAVAARLAELGDLQTPSREETEEFLLDVLIGAVRQIPRSGAAWSWGEFHNGGLQPLSATSGREEWLRRAICAIDLGVDEQPPRTRPGEVLTPRKALARNLVAATERILEVVRDRLEADGVSPYGWSGR